jgi:TfoX/Sxy family transcriptional regulator of competence genes
MIAVIRYYACDGKEFDNGDKCLAYEREKCVQLDSEISVMREKIRSLKDRANESRLRFHLARLDAYDALSGGHVIAFHMKMIEFYKGKLDYNANKSNLYVERRHLNELLNKAYLWFGERKHKSKSAKQERRKKSLRWRQENTPDKWRTPPKENKEDKQ